MTFHLSYNSPLTGAEPVTRKVMEMGVLVTQHEPNNKTINNNLQWWVVDQMNKGNKTRTSEKSILTSLSKVSASNRGLYSSWFQRHQTVFKN